MDMESIEKYTSVSVLTVFATIRGWLGWLIVLYCVAMCTDWLTGTILAIKNAEWNSSKAREGLWHKCGSIFCLAVALLTDLLLSLIVNNIPGMQLTFQYAVLGVRVSEHARQTPNISLKRHFAVGPPHNVLGLLAEASFLWTAGDFIPHGYTAPGPARPLQSQRHGGQLPPIDEQADGRTGLGNAAGVLQPCRRPEHPAQLIHLVAVKVGQCFVLTHAAVLFAGAAVFGGLAAAAAGIRRVGDDGIEAVRFKLADDLQGIPMQNRPAVTAAVFGHPEIRVENVECFGSVRQRHLPFVLSFKIMGTGFFRGRGPACRLHRNTVIFEDKAVLRPVVQLGAGQDNGIAAANNIA